MYNKKQLNIVSNREKNIIKLLKNIVIDYYKVISVAAKYYSIYNK